MATKTDKSDNPTSYAPDNLPTGAVIMWHGDPDNVPPGWAICDGKNNTPDLRDRFVIGAGGNYSYSKYDKNFDNNHPYEGGASSVSLTVEQLPRHSHTGKTDKDGSHSHGNLENDSSTLNYSAADWTAAGPNAPLPNTLAMSNTTTNPPSGTTPIATSDDGDHDHYFTTDPFPATTQQQEEVDILPPFYGLYFIMKIKYTS